MEQDQTIFCVYTSLEYEGVGIKERAMLKLGLLFLNFFCMLAEVKVMSSENRWSMEGRLQSRLYGPRVALMEIQCSHKHFDV